MKNIKLILALLILLCPAGLKADDPKPDSNVNERYVVENVEYNGIDDSKISKTLRENAQRMVGEKYSEQTANDFARQLRNELKGYVVNLRVERGQKPEHVKVVYQMKKIPGFSFSAELPLLVYHSKEGFSGSLEIPIEIHHNVFTFGLVSDADQLLERNAGFRLRYEHRKLGTDAVRFRMDFDSYHQSFNAATKTALIERPDVPDVYRARQNFAPSLSAYPTKDLMLSAGVSFQRLQFQTPELRTLTAYAGTADIRYRKSTEPFAGYKQNVRFMYGLRTATRVLESDFVYTRHSLTADYVLSNGKHLFGAHFLSGYITGTAPLFERFSLGSSVTLRGWNKFDVAPLGGSRAAHGSLEYRYRNLQLFYDVGSVWDPKVSSPAKHGLGFGWASTHFFASLAFPVRHNDVAPVFMIGFRE